jgi:hypothetical protein
MYKWKESRLKRDGEWWFVSHSETPSQYLHFALMAVNTYILARVWGKVCGIFGSLLGPVYEMKHLPYFARRKTFPLSIEIFFGGFSNLVTYNIIIRCRDAQWILATFFRVKTASCKTGNAVYLRNYLISWFSVVPRRIRLAVVKFTSKSLLRNHNLTFRWLMSYIYMEHLFLMFLDHTATQHNR